MLPELDWPQAFVVVSTFLISAGTLYQVALKIWAPAGDETLARREGKADVLATAMASLTVEVASNRRDIEALKDRVGKLIDLTIELSRAGRKSEDL